SRRRHTRCLSDWSSDVCSSDLVGAVEVLFLEESVAAGENLRPEVVADVVIHRITHHRGDREQGGEEVRVELALVRKSARRKQQRSEERRVGKEWRNEEAQEA